MAVTSLARLQFLLAPTLIVALGACAVKSTQIEPVATSLDPFDKMDCKQIAVTEKRLNEEVVALSKQIDEGRAGDRVAMGVGVVFWPALFLIDGKGEVVDELARKKGELQAAQDARDLKGCNIRQRQVDTEKPSKKVAGTYGQ